MRCRRCGGNALIEDEDARPAPELWCPACGSRPAYDLAPLPLARDLKPPKRKRDVDA